MEKAGLGYESPRVFLIAYNDYEVVLKVSTCLWNGLAEFEHPLLISEASTCPDTQEQYLLWCCVA